LVQDPSGRQVGGGETTLLRVAVATGDRIYVRVSVPRHGSGSGQIELRNMTTGRHATATVALGGAFNTSTAEAITDRGVRLARFTEVRWHGVQVQRGDGSWHTLTAEPGLTEVRMRSGTSTIAANTRTQGGFITHWLNCGH